MMVGVETRVRGEVLMRLLVDDIRTRASLTPSLPAVRVGGDMVTYGQLSDSITSYEDVMRRHGMSTEAALLAAIIRRVPSLADIDDPVEQGRLLEQVIAWLGRHLPPESGDLQVAG